MGCYEESLVGFKEVGDRFGEGRALSHVGIVLMRLGRREEAAGYLREGLAIAQQLSDRATVESIERALVQYE